MNTKEAKAVLKRNGLNVYEVGGKFKVAYQGGFTWENWQSDDGLYTGRELVKIARGFTSANLHEHSVDKIVKKDAKRSRRAFERSKLRQERFDELSPLEDKKSHSDRWFYD